MSDFVITDDMMDPLFLDDACVIGAVAARKLARMVWQTCHGDDDFTESGETMHLLSARSAGFLVSVMLADCPPDLRCQWIAALAQSTSGLKIIAADGAAS